jgi:hypothetical protein
LVIPGLRTALGHAAERAEALQASYNSSEQELRELHDAALETCRAVEEGEAQAGSSLASSLRALGGHVTERVSSLEGRGCRHGSQQRCGGDELLARSRRCVRVVYVGDGVDAVANLSAQLPCAFAARGGLPCH